MIKGFYINIVLKACLLKTDVWYYRLNCLFCFKTKRNSVTLIKLTRKYNLVFIEFKSFSTYLSVFSSISTSVTSILMYLIIKQLVKKGFQRFCDYLKLRTDSEELWHL
jgi:hypothetical protein